MNIIWIVSQRFILRNRKIVNSIMAEPYFFIATPKIYYRIQDSNIFAMYNLKQPVDIQLSTVHDTVKILQHRMVKFISHGDKFHTVQFLKSVSLCQPYCGWHYHLQNLKDGILFMIVGDRCVVRLIDDDVIIIYYFNLLYYYIY